MPSFQSRLDLPEQAARRRMAHARWASAGINPRRELISGAFALTLISAAILGWAVVL